jgi:hypothetical protein
MATFDMSVSFLETGDGMYLLNKSGYGVLWAAQIAHPPSRPFFWKIRLHSVYTM